MGISKFDNAGSEKGIKMTQAGYNFFPLMPTELLEKVLLDSKFSDALSLLIALGPKFSVNGNNIGNFLPIIMRKLSIEDNQEVSSSRTYNEVYGLIDLALKYNIKVSSFEEASPNDIYHLCKSIYNYGTIGKFLFRTSKISLYLKMNHDEQAIISKALCSGVISANDGFLDVFHEDEKELIISLLKTRGDDHLLRAKEAIAKATLHTNLLIAISDQDLNKVKALTEWGADLSKLGGWCYKTPFEYSVVRSVLKIISYLKNKGANITIKVKDKMIIDASIEGDLDVVKLLCRDNMSQTIKNKAMTEAIIHENDEVIEYLRISGAEMPKIIDPFILEALALNNPYGILTRFCSLEEDYSIDDTHIIGQQIEAC